MHRTHFFSGCHHLTAVNTEVDYFAPAICFFDDWWKHSSLESSYGDYFRNISDGLNWALYNGRKESKNPHFTSSALHLQSDKKPDGDWLYVLTDKLPGT